MERYVVDVGAHDGLWLSNSHLFLQLGFHALLVEPKEDTFQLLLDNVGVYRESGNATVVNVAVGPEPNWLMMKSAGWWDGTEAYVTEFLCHSMQRGCVRVVPIDQLFRQHRVPRFPFLLSIDTEQNGSFMTGYMQALHDANYFPLYLILENVADRFDRLKALGYTHLQEFRYDSVFRLSITL